MSSGISAALGHLMTIWGIMAMTVMKWPQGDDRVESCRRAISVDQERRNPLKNR